MTGPGPASTAAEPPGPRLTLVALGSTGDVLPFLGLAAGLRHAGYRVRVVTHASLAPLARAQGLDVHDLPADPREVLDTPPGRALVESGRNPLRFGRRMLAVMAPLLESFASTTLESCRNADVIIGSGLAVFLAAPVAEKLGIPLIHAYVQPLTPTTAFRNPFVANPFGRGGFGNRLTHAAYWRGSWALMREHVNRLRRTLGLRPLGWQTPFGGIPGETVSVLYGFSPTVLPPPPDWTPLNIVTGYWFTDPSPDWRPQERLLEFLDAGEPPVSIGFGSMTGTGAERMTRLVLDGLGQSRQRAVLLTGWGGLTPRDVPETIYVADAVPHSWLFPRIAAVVHHGGAGTAAAALRAGVPSVVVPFFGDQFFWGDLLFAHGVATAPMSRHRLSARKLARALTMATSDTEMRSRAGAIAGAIAREDGVATAVEMVDRLLGRAAGSAYANRPVPVRSRPA